MSAITKPLTHSTNVISGKSDAINIEHAAAITTIVADPASSSNTAGTYSIVFKFRGENTTPQEITWKYVDEVTMQADYDTLLTNNSIAL